MVFLRASDGEPIQVDRIVAEQSSLIKSMLEDVGESDEPIPLPNVSEVILKKIVDYCEFHRNDPPMTQEEFDEGPKNSEDILPWDKKFMELDHDVIFELLLAANYLDIKPLLDLGCKTVANLMKGKTADEIRTMFNIVNDFSPEEMENIKRENVWAEEN